MNIYQFYAAANAIYGNVKFASEVTVLFSMKTFCLPLLMSASEALNYSKQQLTQLNTCWNRTYRKASCMNDWESVKVLQALCDRMDLVRMYDERKLSFWSKINSLKNVILQTCNDSLSRTKEFTLLTYHYDVVIGQSTPNDIKNNIINSFINAVLVI